MASLLSVTMYAADAKFYITGDSALVVDAGLTKDKAWNANAIKSEKDTFVLSLKANQDYLLKVAVDGTWEGGQVKGYNELSEKPEGLKDVSNDHNIGFRLNQAGEVKVIYKAGEPEVFKVQGDFYVEVPAKFYVTGDTALVVAAGVDKAKAWKADAIKSEKDTLELDLAAGEYVLKVIVDGDWEGGKVKGFSALTAPAAEGLSADKDDNICFKLAEAGKVKVIYTDKLFKLDGKFYVPQPHYYIAGTMNKWNVGANELLAGKADSLSVSIALEADSLYEFKVVKVVDKDTTWYGNAEEATMEYGSSTGWWLKGDKNVGLQTTKAGEYLFIFEANENNEISVVIPAPAKKYYAKYAPDWAWTLLTEKEGKWLTDTIVYKGIGVNINDKAADEGNMFYSNTVNEAGVRPIGGADFAENDTVYFAFNPADSLLVATLVGKYVAPAVHYYIAGTMNKWNVGANELLAGKADSLSVSIALEADSLYEFKVVKVVDKDTTWYGNAEEATMEYGSSTGWWLKGDKNVGLQTTKAGEYLFIFEANENNEISVVIPAPAKKYYAKYAPDWAWTLLTEKEGKWLTDTIVYKGIGVNINDKAADEGNMFYSNTVNEAGVRPIGGADFAENDTVYFAFNPADSLLVATLVGKYVAPAVHYYIAGTMNKWNVGANELLAGKADSLSVSIALEADSLYEFKVVKVVDKDTTWYGNAEEATMEYGSSTGWWLKGDKNVGLQTTKAGEYLFIFEANENNEISVVIPAPAKKYYAKYAPDWAWTLLTEKEGKWLTDTIVYKGIGVNINDKAADEGNMFFSNTVEEEGVRPIAGAEIAENDTVLFSFNPADSVLTAVLVGKYVAPVAHYFIAGTMTDWAAHMVEMEAGNVDTFHVALALEADSLYSFKVVKILGTDTTWYGNEEAGTMVYGNSTGWWLKGEANIGLQTTKAGEYLFIFEANENNEISVVIPEPDPVEQPKFYVTGNKELVGAEFEWNPAAIKSMTDTLVLDLKADQNYMMKLTLDGEWNERVLGYDALTEKAEGLTRGEGSDNDNICFSLAEDGKVNVIYFVKDEKVTFKLEGNFYVDEPQPQTLADGYYLIGQKGWDVAALDASLLFVANADQEGEFKLDVTLKENDHIKVVLVEKDAIKIWYPEGEVNEYVVDKKHAGNKTVYFRPEGNSEWGTFGGFIWIDANQDEGFENIDVSQKAVKLIHNGQVVILRGDKVYTVTGQVIQ